ncbi:hypothetical protein [Palleronia abyssalis]|uniref:Arsenate reductase n=1 Tax=Palleronia abyssalis TaxID=1501240 RepID=A0A2R8BVS3_9RHOB|nr:hypothetical protein [Palleronia abyssalis]SPJ24249.1 Arsenate reductase [Palleronia abyssalis]
MNFVIHHNPGCSTSRNVLAIIEAFGETSAVIGSLETGRARAQLVALFASAGLTPCTALHTAKSPPEDLGLLDPSDGDDVILDHPTPSPGPSLVRPRGRAPAARARECSTICR